MVLVTSSAPKAAEERHDQIVSFFQELREKQLQQQQQELCRDHRYEVSNRSNIGGPPSSMQLFTRNSQLTCLEFSTASTCSELSTFFDLESQLAWNSRPFFLLGIPVTAA
jgi:hypothetical protein